MEKTRRDFLADVGRGMLIASVGPALAADLGFGSALADEASEKLSFGKLESLVCLMQETGPDKLLPLVVKHLQDGMELRQVVAAAALANARTFGGEDYVGFHTMMALGPAHHMAKELPEERRPLPVLKVLYRNSNRIQEKGGRKDEVLRPVKPSATVESKNSGELLRDLVRRKDLPKAEQTLAALTDKSAKEALDSMLWVIEDATEVHRVVMVSRSWDLVDLVGLNNANTLLRQSVHYCVQNEGTNYTKNCGGARDLMPKLLDQHKLLSREPVKKASDDKWVDDFSQVLFKAKPDDAAGAAAEALAEGIDPHALGEAISLAANQLLLRDSGRTKGQTAANKPEGSVHGDSIGLHASDSANAWRNMARVSNPRNQMACLILGAYQVALDRGNRGGDFQKWEPYPRTEALAKVKLTTREDLLRELEGAIKDKDQALACAVVHCFGKEKHPASDVFDLLLRYAVSEDGALHAEKYFRTVREEFASTREAFRWRHLIALARVTASEYGQPAPGYKEACQLLKV